MHELRTQYEHYQALHNIPHNATSTSGNQSSLSIWWMHHRSPSTSASSVLANGITTEGEKTTWMHIDHITSYLFISGAGRFILALSGHAQVLLWHKCLWFGQVNPKKSHTLIYKIINIIIYNQWSMMVHVWQRYTCSWPIGLAVAISALKLLNLPATQFWWKQLTHQALWEKNEGSRKYSEGKMMNNDWHSEPIISFLVVTLSHSCKILSAYFLEINSGASKFPRLFTLILLVPSRAPSNACGTWPRAWRHLAPAIRWSLSVWC